MNWKYTYRHWGLTILIGPLLFILWMNIPDWHYDISNVVSLYLMSLVYSVPLSIPTFSIYIIIFYLLTGVKMPALAKKIILLVFTITGIGITVWILASMFAVQLISFHAVAACVTGLVLKINKPAPQASRFLRDAQQ